MIVVVVCEESVMELMRGWFGYVLLWLSEWRLPSECQREAYGRRLNYVCDVEWTILA